MTGIGCVDEFLPTWTFLSNGIPSSLNCSAKRVFRYSLNLPASHLITFENDIIIFCSASRIYANFPKKEYREKLFERLERWRNVARSVRIINSRG